MRAKFARTLSALFDTRLAACFPHVRPEKAKLASPGSRCYAITVGPSVTWFVQLVILEDQNKFAVEIAWSRIGQYPAKRVKGEPRGVVPMDPEAFIDLAEIWLGPAAPATSEEGGLWVDLWWRVMPRESLGELERRILSPDSHGEDIPPGRLEVLVDHAIGVLVCSGVPQLRSAAEREGLRVDRAPAWEPAPQEIDPALLPKMTRLRRVARTREETADQLKALQERIDRLLRHRAVLSAKVRKGKGRSRPSSRSR